MLLLSTVLFYLFFITFYFFEDQILKGRKKIKNFNRGLGLFSFVLKMNFSFYVLGEYLITKLYLKARINAIRLILYILFFVNKKKMIY